MEKGLIISISIILVVLGLIIGLIYLTGGFGKKYPTTDVNTKGMILFYGVGCPHCKIVEDIISENNLTAKIDFVQSEVWHNKANSNLLVQKAQICGISADTIGIPFLFDGNNKCYVGEDVINFFKNEAGIK